MQAVRIHDFGGIDRMRLERISLPIPSAGQVLVEMHAAGVGPWDSWVRQGKSALHQPLPLTPGADLSGLVAALGPDVDTFSLGDAVFGVTNASFTGSYAQYALAEAGRIALKPPTLSFVEAAALPVVAVTAWTMVAELGKLKAGDRVLVHGGAGNVGAYAVQFAKRLGAYVMSTALEPDVALVAALGADQVVNVGTSDFVAECTAVDLVVDTVGGDTQKRSFEVLGSGGRLVSSVSQPDVAIANSLGVMAKFFIVDVTQERLEVVASHLDGLQVLVGEALELNEFRLAHEMLEGRPHRPGKIVLNLADHSRP